MGTAALRPRHPTCWSRDSRTGTGALRYHRRRRPITERQGARGRRIFVEKVARYGEPRSRASDNLCGTGLAQPLRREPHMMSLVRLLGFTTLGCGCITGRYREVATNREITYVEEKGRGCQHHAHRRNHTLTSSAFGLSGAAIKAS